VVDSLLVDASLSRLRKRGSTRRRFDKWKAEGHATESGDAKGYPAATFNARPRSGLFVDKHETMAAIGAPTPSP
jgi:hypothetical protein